MKLALRVTGLVLRNEVQKPKHYVHKKLSDYMVAAKSSDNLWIAAGDGQLDRVKELVEGGMDPNARDEYGYTALHAAVSYNQRPIIDFLLERGADVNIEDDDQDTPLYVAETPELARYLVEKGANPSHKNGDGLTPARHALQEGWRSVAEALAEITQEELPSVEEALEATVADVLPESADLNICIEEAVRRIQEQGGGEDASEEEIRAEVTRIILEELQKSVQR